MKQFSERISSVPKSGIREIFDMVQGLDRIIDLGIGEPDFRTPRFIREKAKQSIDSGFGKYTANSGLIELREQIAAKLRRENRIIADPNTEVIVTSGATQAIFVAMNVLLNPGDEVLLPTPLFSAYKYSAMLAGATSVEIPTPENLGYQFDADAIEKNCSKRTKILVLNSPCNPTGSVMNRTDLERACDIALRHDLYVISDEIYEKYLYDGAVHFSPAALTEFRDRIITVNGFSKTFAMTGWRLGYAVANEKIISAMIRYNMYNAVCASSFVQIAGVAALRHSLSFFHPILDALSKNRKLLGEYMDRLGLDYQTPMGAFYGFPRIPSSYSSSLSFVKKFLEACRVVTIPGSSFGVAGEGHIRISYALKKTELERALSRLEGFIGK